MLEFQELQKHFSLGTSYPLTEFERKSLHASAMAQDEVASLYAGIKPPVNVHPGRHHTSPEEAARVFAEAGGDLKRFCISHVERTLVSDESLWAFVEAFPHSYLEFDLFGNEVSSLNYYPKGLNDCNYCGKVYWTTSHT